MHTRWPHVASPCRCRAVRLEREHALEARHAGADQVRNRCREATMHVRQMMRVTDGKLHGVRGRSALGRVVRALQRVGSAHDDDDSHRRESGRCAHRPGAGIAREPRRRDLLVSQTREARQGGPVDVRRHARVRGAARRGPSAASRGGGRADDARGITGSPGPSSQGAEARGCGLVHRRPARGGVAPRARLRAAGRHSGVCDGCREGRRHVGPRAAHRRNRHPVRRSRVRDAARALCLWSQRGCSWRAAFLSSSVRCRPSCRCSATRHC